MSATVIDASAMVDFLLNTPVSDQVAERLRDVQVHAPAHFDAEILSALGRLHRADKMSSKDVVDLIAATAQAPIVRHPLPPLLAGAWQRRENSSVMDALYIELAEQLDLSIVTTDTGMAAASSRAVLLRA